MITNMGWLEIICLIEVGVVGLTLVSFPWSPRPLLHGQKYHGLIRWAELVCLLGNKYFETSKILGLWFKGQLWAQSPLRIAFVLLRRCANYFFSWVGKVGGGRVVSWGALVGVKWRLLGGRVAGDKQGIWFLWFFFGFTIEKILCYHLRYDIVLISFVFFGYIIEKILRYHLRYDIVISKFSIEHIFILSF